MESKVDDLLSPVLNLLREQFEQLRSELLSELRQRRPSTSATASQLLGRSHDSSEFRPRDAPWPSEGRLLPSHKSFLSKKLLEEEREASRDERVYPMPLRALLGGAPKPPVVEERLRESACSSSSSSCSEAQVAPPSEPPAQLSSQLHTSSALTSAASERPKLQRKRTSMTEKAFSLTRGGSMTSLETFTTGWLQRLLVRLVSNIFFKTLSMVMLCANAVVIGVQTDYMAVNNLLVIPWGLRFLDITFCVFFTLELALRIFAHRRRFFRMNGCAWNVMDLLLVSAHVGEEILLVITDLQNQAPAGSAASGRASNTNPDVMRVIRILRAIKVVRLIGAVRFTQDLQLLINCLFRSLKQFFWSALLLLMAIYVVAIYITQAATSYRIENEEALGGCASVESCRVMTKWWGSMPQSVLSLFQGVTGGVDWHAIADPLIDGISPWFGLLFIVFMAFCILALLNVITGTFVETMSQQAKELQLRNRIYQARRLFREIDIDGSGFISPDEILGQTDRPAVQEFFETIDVDPSDARGLVEVIDIDGNGKINFEEFLEGSLRLNGHAKSSDLIMLAREMKRFQANQIRDIAEIKADLKSALS